MANLYNEGKFRLVDGTVVWASSTIGVLLVSSIYAYDPDHTFVSDLTNELTNPGYARQTLGGKSGPTKDNATNRVYYLGGDVIFAGLGVGSTPAAAILFRNTGVDATSNLIGYAVLTAPPAPNGGPYTIEFSALTSGLIQLNDT